MNDFIVRLRFKGLLIPAETTGQLIDELFEMICCSEYFRFFFC